MNDTEMKNEFRRLIMLANEESLNEQKKFILSLGLGVRQETVNSSVPLASCL